MGQIETHRADGCVTLTLRNDGKRNALDLPMWRALTAALHELVASSQTDIVVIRGADGHFCAGADISEFETERGTPEAAKAYEAVNTQTYDAIRALKVPTIAVIEGVCFGGGLAIATACDVRIAASDARFAAPPAKLGLAYPPHAAADLATLVGPGMAKWMLFTGDPIDAARAHQAGLVEMLFDAAAFEEQLTTCLEGIARRARLSQIAGKSAVDAALGRRTEAQAHVDVDACFASEDYREGRAAFLKKRKPVFTGR
ncbi:MAG: enoyl-CoA hydratase/isomerase family protein [Devosiaceae bacterium]|nr:enoyl-CoA hydratase/isomerase family protein [Devosiaceae bacterium MH13]